MIGMVQSTVRHCMGITYNGTCLEWCSTYTKQLYYLVYSIDGMVYGMV